MRLKHPIFCAVLSVVLVGATGPSHADDAKPPYQGVWEGVIGTNKVQVCFQGTDSGSYYYLRHQRGIVLKRTERGNPQGAWDEQTRDPKTFDWTTTGSWQLAPPVGRAMEGVWTDGQTQKKLPIRLGLLAKNTDGGCEPRYYAPIVRAMKIKTGTMVFGDRKLVTLQSEVGTAFQVPDDTPHRSRLNAFLKQWLNQQVVDSHECKSSGGGEWHKTMEPVWWTVRWLVLKDWMPDTFCGGAHGAFSVEFLTFDLSRGQFLDPWSWVSSPTELDRLRSWGKTDGKPNRLRRLIEKRNPRDDCDALFWLDQPYPTAKGMVFPTSYSHASRACNDEVLISYQDLRPFLTPAGRAAVQSILQTR